jgi:hypothetical protein
MPRLIEAELASVGKPNRRLEPEALLAHGPDDVGALAGELVEGRVDVVAHQVELVSAGAVGGMRGELGGREREDEPPAACVDRRQLEHVSEESANALGVLREEDRVGPP